MSVKFSVLSDVLTHNKDKNDFYNFVKQFDLSDASLELHRKFVDQFIKNHKWRWQKKTKFRPKYFQKHFGTWFHKFVEANTLRCFEDC